MSKVASLEIEIAANVARLTEDFAKAKKEVGSSMTEIKHQVKESMAGVLESMEGVNKKIAAMQDAFATLGEFAMAGIIGDKILEMGTDFAEAAEKISRTAQITGMTTTQVQELGYAATATGASSESMTTGMRKLSMMITQAKNGSRTAVAAFKDVGISQEDVKNSSPHEILMKIADAYRNSANNASKSANAQMLFGRAGADLIPTLNQGSAGLDDLGAKARELGVVLGADAIEKGEKAAATFKEVSAVTHAASMKLGSDLIPGLKTLSIAFVDSAKDGGALHGAVEVLNAIVLGATEVITTAVNTVHAFGDALGAIAATIAHPISAKTIWQDWAHDVDMLQAKQDKFFASLHGAQAEVSIGGESGDDAVSGHIGSDTGMGRSADSRHHASRHHAAAHQASQMNVYEQQLADAQIYYQQTNDLRQMSLEQEIAYWQKILDQTNVSANDRIAIERKVAQLKLSELRKSASDQQKLSSEQINSDEQTALNAVAIDKQKAEERLKTGEITQNELLKLKNQFEDQKYQIERDAQQKRIALMQGDPNSDPAALQQQLDKLAQIQQQHLLQLQTMQTQSAKQTQSIWDPVFKSMSQAFDTTVKGMIMGTTTWQKGMRNMMQSILGEFINMGVQMVTTWAENEMTRTMASITGTEERSAAQDSANSAGLLSSAETIIKAIMNDAVKVFSGVWAALSGIPYVGPALAAASAPAAMATVAGVASSVASSAGGDWQIPSDRLNFVHKNETILPADKSKGLDDLIRNGSSGSGAPIHIHGNPASTFTMSQLQTMLRQMGRNFVPLAR
ncbi:MAG: hypothetical protein M0Z83_00935 [Betaproteobacteria bacterium]|nr:hypothetical protein [Betaproteobacteria bacterium]